MLRFILVEFGGVAEGEADVVEALEETVFAKCVDFEGRLESAVIGYSLLLKRDSELVAGNGFSVAKKSLNFAFAEAGEDDAVFSGVGEEDVGESWRDNDAESEITESPGGVFAAGTAAEVFAGDKNLCVLVARVIEDEFGQGLAFGRLTPVEEKEVAVAGALDALEELLGDDLVRIDVGAVERSDGRCLGLEGFH